MEQKEAQMPENEKPKSSLMRYMSLELLALERDLTEEEKKKWIKSKPFSNFPARKY